MESIDHEYTDEIVCPYCGEVFTDSWEYEPDEGVIYCDSCDMDFKYERDVSITYITSKAVE